MAMSAASIMSPKEELNGYGPEELNKLWAVLPILESMSKATKISLADGSLPFTSLLPEELDDELYNQRLEIRSGHRLQDWEASGEVQCRVLKDAGDLQHMCDVLQINQETAIQDMLQKIDITNEDLSINAWEAFQM